MGSPGEGGDSVQVRNSGFFFFLSVICVLGIKHRSSGLAVIPSSAGFAFFVFNRASCSPG